MDRESPEAFEGTPRASESFDLKAVLMLVSRHHLGESHVLSHILPILNHIYGKDVLELTDDPEEFQELVDRARGIIISQHPYLELIVPDFVDLHDDRFTDALSASETRIALTSATSPGQQ